MRPFEFTCRCRTRRAAAVVAVAATLLGSAACEAPFDRDAAAPAAQTAEAPPLRVIQHEVPKRDFVGPQPGEFRWSPIQGADRYALGLWNETDRLMWRTDDLKEPTVAWPKGLVLDDGTYFWSVSALQNGREIAKSGSAAFVIEQ